MLKPEVPARVNALLDQVRGLEKELDALKGKLASTQGDELLAQAVDVSGIKVLAAMLQGADAKALRETLDKLKDKLKSAAIVLATVDGGKVQLAAGVTADRMGSIKAGELVNFVAQQVGGKGGGKPDMAMAGGTDPSQAGRGAGFGARLGGRAGLSAAGAVSAPVPRPPGAARRLRSASQWSSCGVNTARAPLVGHQAWVGFAEHHHPHRTRGVDRRPGARARRGRATHAAHR